jgi:hypothetical protein
MISLTIKKKLISLSTQVQGLATAALARSALAPEFQAAIATTTVETDLSLTLAEATLERMIVKYSEQLVFQPLQEIRYWFTYSSGAFLEPGYPPLYYSRDRSQTVSANKSAVAAVGEGIAGFIAQRHFHCSKLARPNHDYPDIVMESHNTTFLVEAKATLRSQETQIEAVVDEELPRLAALTASARLLDFRPVRGLLIGTAIISEIDYYCYMVELELI